VEQSHSVRRNGTPVADKAIEMDSERNISHRQRRTWIVVLACSLAFFSIPLAVGYSWPVAALYALISAMISFHISRKLSFLNQAEQPSFIDRSDWRSRLSCADEKPIFERSEKISELKRDFKPFQMLLFLVFFSQAAVSFLLILVAWLAVQSGWTGSSLNPPLVASVSSKIFPVPAGNAQAQAMLNSLFAPMTALYATSLACFVLAGFASIGAIRKANWKAFVSIGLFLIVILDVYWPADTYQTATPLKKELLDGSLLAYLAFYCGCPMLLGIPSAYLLFQQKQQLQED
jgi:hypothetical protein